MDSFEERRRKELEPIYLTITVVIVVLWWIFLQFSGYQTIQIDGIRAFNQMRSIHV